MIKNLENSSKWKEKIAKTPRQILAFLKLYQVSRLLWLNNLIAFSFAIVSVSHLVPVNFVLTKVKADLNEESAILAMLSENELMTMQNNTLMPTSNPTPKETPPIREMEVVVTGYSSTTWQTDDDPFVTAAGTSVRDGIVANNLLPFGTKIKFPEIYPDRTFVVEDRMSWEKNNNHIDIWFPEYQQALNFGAKRTLIQIVGS